MRLWSIHPGYLDAKGLVALWREGLLAQKVLAGNTKGYRNHPQLIRFKNTGNPLEAISSYLEYVVDEADKRGYNFDRSKIINIKFKGKIPVTIGQLGYEFAHLSAKLKERATESRGRINNAEKIEPHPIFIKVSGEVEYWEAIQRNP